MVPPSKPRRSPSPQDRQRDPERTRKLIIDAAVAEFAAHGYAGARVSAIAARAGVNQQLISYYFEGKEGLYQAISEKWWERADELATPDMTYAAKLRAFALEQLHNPDGVRLFAWGGLEYAGPADDPDHETRSERLRSDIDDFRDRQAAGELPAAIDPVCLSAMLMSAAMAPTLLPQVIEGTGGVDPRSPEFLEHFADQVALVARLLGLD